MSFQVGDPVTIIPNLTFDTHAAVVNAMVEYAGQETFVTEIYCDADVRLAIDNGIFIWPECTLYPGHNLSAELPPSETSLQFLLDD